MTTILERVNNPEGLKSLSIGELNQLAGEIRQFIIENVSKTGGHLAPNLGVVELTIALHRCFDSPRDKFVWDVGHQAYVHKILTGRREKFGGLRQLGGISGFPKRIECPHDVFDTGHSSTSVSGALGIAIARDLRKEDHQVVAVIGDGALTGGMAFEALNHAGHIRTNLIVVLNDNEMSIAENVGAMASYLSRMRTDPKYYKGKEEIENILGRIPKIGPNVLRVLERVKDSFKYLVVPGMLFEELGFTYLGPIDGHNIPSLLSILNDAKNIPGPVLVHVLTKKGCGYLPAEENPDKFHGIGPFDQETGISIKKPGPPSYTEVFSKALVQVAQKDERVLAITAAMPTGTGLDRFHEQFPERFFDVGIAEQHAITLAAGLATQGFKPVVALYSTFLQRAYDQVLHDVALQNLPVIMALDRAGIVGEDGPTHHGLFDYAFLRHIPNLVIMAPKDEAELCDMVQTAAEYCGPIVFRYPRGAGRGVALPERFQCLPIGKAEILRPGHQVTLLAVGSMVTDALQAAEELAKRGIEAEVINSRFVKPLDEEAIISSLQKTGTLITIEEHVLAGGFGSAVLEMLEDRDIIGYPVRRIGIPDEFVEHGASNLLKAKYGLSPQGIVQATLETIPDLMEKGPQVVTGNK